MRDKQIEEMAKDLCSKYKICTCNNRDGHCSTPQQHAQIMYELGYRKQEWISVEDRLPTKEDADENGEILAVAHKDGYVRSWSYDWLKNYPTLFTHWMPLPEAPKMKGD